MRISIIVPVYNEENNIPTIHSRLIQVLTPTRYACELIFVDDGSQDQSWEMLKRLCNTKEGPLRTRSVRLSRNFGQHSALAAGFWVAKGEILVTIDADGQIDPQYIESLLQKLEEGYDFVGGIRTGVGDSFLKRRLPSYLLNRLLGQVIGKKLRDYGCPLNAMRAEIAKKMSEYGDMQKYYKPLAIKLSQHVAEIEVPHERRQNGHSKYHLLDLVDLFFDFVTNFSKRIFQRIVLVGLGLTSTSVLAGLLYLLCRFGLEVFPQPAIRIQFLIFISFVFGVQLIVLGVLGEFVIRIYGKTSKEPIYRIEEIL